MPEYIDRERAIKIFEDADTDVLEDYGPEVGSMWGFSRDKVSEVIQSIPFADVEPVRHGRWIPTTMSNSTGPIVRCSACGQYINPSATAMELGRQSLEPLWCEKCGAKMDK